MERLDSQSENTINLRLTSNQMIYCLENSLRLISKPSTLIFTKIQRGIQLKLPIIERDLSSLQKIFMQFLRGKVPISPIEERQRESLQKEAKVELEIGPRASPSSITMNSMMKGSLKLSLKIM